jgi:hypothetical protein
MVCTCTGDFTQDALEPSNARARAAKNELLNAARRTPPPPPPPPSPVSLEQLLATQNGLMRVMTENLVQREACSPHRQLGVETSYNWLRIIESKFELLHCTEIQKTLFVAWQLH